MVRAFNALWSLDGRSFYLLNDALMVLLLKIKNPTKLKDFRPISLMHSFGKLFTKGLALRLAPSDSLKSSEATRVLSSRAGASMTTSAPSSLLVGGCMAVASRLP